MSKDNEDGDSIEYISREVVVMGACTTKRKQASA